MKKSVRVKQHDVSDCGPACLASVAAYFGLHVSISQIRQYANTNKKGSSLLGLIEAADSLNFKAKGVMAKSVSLKNIPTPSIFHLSMKDGLQHFVVVYKVNGKRVFCMDPAVGKIVNRSILDFQADWSGAVLLIVPSEQFNKGNYHKSVFERFWELIIAHRELMIKAFLGSLVYSFLGLGASFYVQKMVDYVLPTSNRQLLNLLSILMVILLILRFISGYLKSLLLLKTGQKIDGWLILKYYRHLMELPQRFFDHMRVGEIVSRVHDALRIRVFINDVALGVVIHVFTMILCIIALFIHHWKLAVIMLTAIPIYLIIYQLGNKVNVKWQRQIVENGAKLESQLVETVHGMATIRRFGCHNYFNLKNETGFFAFIQVVFKSSCGKLMLAHTTEFMTGIVSISILWAGGNMVIAGTLTCGELLSFYMVTVFFMTPLQAVIEASRSMQEALIAADRLYEIMDLESEHSGDCGTENFPGGDILFENIHFYYEANNRIFGGLNFRILQFKMTAITGESGSGKSTLHSLIQKFYPLSRGNILIGDTDIQCISTKVLRKKIAVVPQQVDFFHGTIISNIAIGQRTPERHRIHDICQKLGIHDVINKLPGQYDTLIRENGNNLSGGQKQRLGIARALYQDPSILILDEATSALDIESERKVRETLIWFHSLNKTIIIISHRTEPLKWCDSVIYLKPDRLAVSGKHEQLLSENPDYAELWKRSTI